MNRPLPPAMTPRRQISPLVLAVCGLVLMGIDVFFALARPALLPEDARYIGMSSLRIHDAVPGPAR